MDFFNSLLGLRPVVYWLMRRSASWHRGAREAVKEGVVLEADAAIVSGGA